MTSFTILVSSVTNAFTYKILNFRNKTEICNIIINGMYMGEADSQFVVVLWQLKNIISSHLLCHTALSATQTANIKKTSFTNSVG
jgi:hypothetical protein